MPVFFVGFLGKRSRIPVIRNPQGLDFGILSNYPPVIVYPAQMTIAQICQKSEPMQPGSGGLFLG